jgi:glycogen operon protein
VNVKTRNLVTRRGVPSPLGATPELDGINFSIFSEKATAVELLLFESHTDRLPFATIPLDPQINRTFYLWHIFVEGLRPGILYAYRVDGPCRHEDGDRFNSNRVLIDPYARGNSHTLWNRKDALDLLPHKDNVRTSMRSIVIDTSNYRWEGVEPPETPMKDSIIYEMHVGGFTRSRTSKVEYPGTFQGIIEKIPYLKELGITAIELLPIFDFDAQEVFGVFNGIELKNYWGYSTIGFFAPQSDYCTHPEKGAHLNEFRNMVKELHRNGIEVILDVVFNHTEEGDHNGPTIHFKGLANDVYYHLEKNKRYYSNYSGCGNAVNCNHPIVSKFITDCLRFWVEEMHVDGFRFDLGSILARDTDGRPMKYPPVLWEIELSHTFADTKLIAEAWDAVGLYQVGSFPGNRWAEWNGYYRDDVRRFVKGDKGIAGYVASRIAGSSDIFQHKLEKPTNSINFITAHDGFTMMDLVSYNKKNNWANGEFNRDGTNQNYSWNCGIEGPTDDPDISQLRLRQIKNFATILMISNGVPMILSGDEVGKSQGGNNNVYCQDNELSWFDWSLTQTNKEIFRFYKHAIALRKRLHLLRRGEFYSGEVNSRGIKDIEWHGCELNAPGFSDSNACVLACTMGGFHPDDPDVHVMMNMYYEPLPFKLRPLPADYSWYRVIDTSEPSPGDILPHGEEQLLNNQESCLVPERTIMLLISKKR